MKLHNLFEETELKFYDPTAGKTIQSIGADKSTVPMSTWKMRVSVRNASKTNLITLIRGTSRTNTWSERTYYIISDVPPLYKKQWTKLVGVSFDPAQTDASHRVEKFPSPQQQSLNLWKNNKIKTDKLYSEEQWDMFEERDQRVFAETVKTVTWKQFTSIATGRYLPIKDDFDE